MNNFSSAQFGLQIRKQHHRVLRTQWISLVSGLIAVIAVPSILNAASLFLNPSKIAKDNGIVVLAEQSAKPAPKARLNVDSNGVIFKGYDPVAYFTRHQAVKGTRQFTPGSEARLIISFPWLTKSHLARILPNMFHNMVASALIT
jgi:hypothetical protein